MCVRRGLQTWDIAQSAEGSQEKAKGGVEACGGSGDL